MEQESGQVEQPSEQSAPAPEHKSGFVGVVGKPNVGKSTLINLYVGAKIAITSDKPQTTRHIVRGIMTRPDVQAIFVDTPGIHRPMHALGKYMVRSAVEVLDDVDVVVFLVDGSRMPSQEDEEIGGLLRERVKAPVLLALNKMDLLKRDMVGEVTEAYWSLVDYSDWMRISATKRENTGKLLDMIVERLPAGPPLFPEDEITDQPMQGLAAELIREKILLNTRQEIPHAVAVVVDEWEDRSEILTYIAASIWVERQSQKSIIIGEHGQMLKRIGQAAREEIEEWVGHQVYLDVTVKVREKWRRDERLLRELGYVES